MYDCQLERVRTAHEAFGVPVNDVPGFPSIDAEGEKLLSNIAGAVGQIAKMIFRYAEHANERGDEGLRLLLTRAQLHTEETAELIAAFANRDLPNALNELTDIDYVTNGTYLVLGLAPLKETAQLIVAASQMTKLGPDGKPIVNEAGRWVKGPNFRPPGPAMAELVDQLLEALSRR